MTTVYSVHALMSDGSAIDLILFDNPKAAQDWRDDRVQRGTFKTLGVEHVIVTPRTVHRK